MSLPKAPNFTRYKIDPRRGREMFFFSQLFLHLLYFYVFFFRIFFSFVDCYCVCYDFLLRLTPLRSYVRGAHFFTQVWPKTKRNGHGQGSKVRSEKVRKS